MKQPVTGYADVFQPKYKQRIVIVDDALEIVTWGLATQGIGPDGVTKENLAKVRPLLASWLPLVKVYDSDSPKTALLNGDVDLGIAWSGEAAILIREQPGKFAYVLPKEGAHMFIDNLAIPKGAEHVDAAHAFIDYILRPDVSRKISQEFPYTNPNVEARKLLSQQERANPASYPPGNREALDVPGHRRAGGRRRQADHRSEGEERILMRRDGSAARIAARGEHATRGDELRGGAARSATAARPGRLAAALPGDRLGRRVRDRAGRRSCSSTASRTAARSAA